MAVTALVVAVLVLYLSLLLGSSFKQPVAFKRGAVLRDTEPSDRVIQPNPGTARQKGKFLFMYTCKICQGRNANMISKLAYYYGTVVATCEKCKSRHMLADNQGRLDFSDEFGPRIDEYLSKKDESVKKLKINGSILKTHNIVDKDGVLTLIPKNSSLEVRLILFYIYYLHFELINHVNISVW